MKAEAFPSTPQIPSRIPRAISAHTPTRLHVEHETKDRRRCGIQAPFPNGIPWVQRELDRIAGQLSLPSRSTKAGWFGRGSLARRYRVYRRSRDIEPRGISAAASRAGSASADVDVAGDSGRETVRSHASRYGESCEGGIPGPRVAAEGGVLQAGRWIDKQARVTFCSSRKTYGATNGASTPQGLYPQVLFEPLQGVLEGKVELRSRSREGMHRVEGMPGVLEDAQFAAL